MNLAMTIMYCFFMMMGSMLAMSNSPISMFMFIIMMVTIMAGNLSITMVSPWTATILFMGMVGGLLILFSFVISSSRSIPKSMDMGKIPIMMIGTAGIMSSSFCMSKTYPSIYSSSIPMMMMLLLNLNITLFLVSKILMNPLLPMKSNSY